MLSLGTVAPGLSSFAHSLVRSYSYCPLRSRAMAKEALLKCEIKHLRYSKMKGLGKEWLALCDCALSGGDSKIRQMSCIMVYYFGKSVSG